ncbi:hypothetical protein BGX29_011512 [Mortierella sp. GBA35]|nr:hypothetical protein BGX29_011512 [Mortierella sp. GBA35]
MNISSNQSGNDKGHQPTGRPKVLIVGAGLGGLTLGMLLHKAGIPFEIFERASEVKNLGSAMMLTSTTAYLFLQCGIYEEFVAMAKPVLATQVGNEQRGVEYDMLFEQAKEMFGYDNYIIARPLLYDLLLRQVPKERIHMGAKITQTYQDDNGVRIRCSSGTVYEGDILVGADGAYSSVRQNLYSQLKTEGKLPASDALPLPYSTVCLVGQTRRLSFGEFPKLAIEHCQFMNMIGDNKPYSWMTFTMTDHTVCWAVVRYLDEEKSKHDGSFNNSEWGAEATEAMCKEVQDFQVISGSEKLLTMGDLIEWTSKDQISKVMLEEKLFETWYNGRTVLLGDACHKLNPAGGAGASNALHDAIVLSNYIYALPPRPTAKDTEAAFKAYKDERISWVQAAFESSQIFKTMASTGIISKLIRFSAKYMPVWIQRRIIIQMSVNRPQSAILPIIEDKGSSDIPFEIFDQAAEVKPLGSAIALNFTTALFLHQLGVYDELAATGKRLPAIKIGNEQGGVEFGAEQYVVNRLNYYQLLLRQVDKEHVHLGKKILSTKQGGNGVITDAAMAPSQYHVRKVRDFSIVSKSEKPLILGDLIDWSLKEYISKIKEYISKIMLEEKVFKTWHHDRTVPIGEGE